MITQTPFDLATPEDRIARINALAFDLAYGVVNEIWSPIFYVSNNQFVHEDNDKRDFLNYLSTKWGFRYPSVELLVIFNYLQKVSTKNISAGYGISLDVDCYRITEKAVELLSSQPPASVFISYNRRQSSTFALLILNALKREGLEAFLDVRNIAPGDDWHGLIEEEVKKHENFIVLLNRTTLKSTYVRQEIRWAIEGGISKRIIPIFHGGLKPKSFKDDEFQELLAKNAIIVEQETAIAYESALLQLLNYFGRTP